MCVNRGISFLNFLKRHLFQILIMKVCSDMQESKASNPFPTPKNLLHRQFWKRPGEGKPLPHHLLIAPLLTITEVL